MERVGMIGTASFYETFYPKEVDRIFETFRRYYKHDLNWKKTIVLSVTRWAGLKNASLYS